MVQTDPGSAREEAERLVAMALAALRLATGGAGGPDTRSAGAGGLGDMIIAALGHRDGLATGSAECVVCPICRTIAALRDPRPEVAERLAAGAGDLAAGVASLMRAFATVTAAPPGPTGPAGAPPRAPVPDPTAPTTGSPPPSAEGPRTVPAAAPPTATVTASSPSPTAAPTTGSPTVPAGGPRTVPAEESQAAPMAGVWRTADRTGHDLWPAAEPDVWARATRAADPGPASGAASGTATAPEPVTTEAAATGGRSGAVPASRAPVDQPVTGEEPPGNGA